MRRCGYLAAEWKPQWLFAANLIRIHAHSGKIHPRFLHAWFCHPEGRAALIASSQSTTGQLNLTASTIARVMIPVPPWQDQLKAVEFLHLASIAHHHAIAAAEIRLSLAREIAFRFLKTDPIAEDPDEYSDGAYYLPAESRWPSLMKVAENRAEAIDKALVAIKDTNSRYLSGVLAGVRFNDERRFGDAATMDGLMQRLLAHFAKIPLGNRDLLEPDVLGNSYEYLIEAVIGLPAQLFFGTGIPAALVICNWNKPKERKGHILFIDAATEGLYREGKSRNFLDPADILRIAAIYHAWADPKKVNEFLVTDECVLKGPQQERRFDLVIHVNGLPLVVNECKDAADSRALEKAAGDLLDYQRPETGAPRMFETVHFCVALSRHQARFGAVATELKHFAPWKSLRPFTKDGLRKILGRETTAQDELLACLCHPAQLLEFLRGFVAFERRGGRLVKKLARYQQWEAVKDAADRVSDDRCGVLRLRGGVIWHTTPHGIRRLQRPASRRAAGSLFYRIHRHTDSQNAGKVRQLHSPLHHAQVGRGWRDRADPQTS